MLPSQWTRPRLIPRRAGLLALLVALLIALSAPAQEFVKRSLVLAGDPTPVSLNADVVGTWMDGGERVFLLRRDVWIEQGLNKISMPECVVWVDEQRQKQTGIYYLTVYGEGKVDVREASQQSLGTRALLELATRGQLTIKARTRTLHADWSKDPVFERAKLERKIARDAPAVQTTNYQMSSLERPGPAPAAPPAAEATGVSPPPAWTPPPVANPVMPLSSQQALASTMPPGPPVAAPATSPAIAPPPPPGQLPAVESTFVPPPSPVPPVMPVLPTQFAQPTVPGESIRELPGAGSPPSSPGRPPLTRTEPPPDTAPLRKLNVRPRSSQDYKLQTKFDPATGETAWIVTGGILLTISNPSQDIGIVDMEADRLVFWTKGKSQNMFNPAGETDNSRQYEFYLAGNVEIRSTPKKRSPKDPEPRTQTVRADEVFYNVARNTAVAIKADVELQDPKLLYPLHVTANELFQYGPKLFRADRSEVFSSGLPSDPGLKVVINQSELEELDEPRRNIFGLQFRDPTTGQVVDEPQRIYRGRNMTLRLNDVPIFYLPYIQGDPQDPLGPLDNLGLNYNRIFGFQILSTWNVYDLLGFRPLPGTRWRFDVDYLSERGPALGTFFNYAGAPIFGSEGRNETLFKLYGILDNGVDILGGNPDRGQFNVVQTVPPPEIILPMTHPYARGRALWRTNTLDMPYGFMVQAQVSGLSDRNYMEQFFNYEFNNSFNQETFVYGKQQQGNWAWTLLGEARIRNWVTETNWFPKANGFLLGQKFFDLFTYNLRGSAGMAQLLPTHEPTFAYLPTDVFTNTARLDLMQDISLPFQLGAFKIVPYGIIDLTYYSEDVNKNDVGRFLGGGGARASVPLSRLYPEAQSELFNLNGLFHKIVFAGNYYNVYSNTEINQLPQLDRLNDDTTDQALRDIRPRQPQLNPANAANLMNSNEFNPQFYALRRLVDTRVDSLQFLNVFQFDVRQRLQTKRGFPGNQHIIDWMILDVGASVFPQANRDNFGETFGILYYDWTWNVGDMTSLVSSGWADPIGGGPRVFNIGANFMRSDRTNLYLGYRELDPLNSKAVIGGITYVLSAKYAVTGSSIYDFGVNTQVNTLALSRIGTDLTMTLGISYNSILQNFGVNFIILPNLFGRSGNPMAAMNTLTPGAPGAAPPGSGGPGGFGSGGMTR